MPIINSILKDKFLRRTSATAIGATAALFGVSLMRGISQTLDEENKVNSNYIEGFSDNTYSSYLRHQQTDFGSPYQGINKSSSLYVLENLSYNATPIFVNNQVPVDQKIAEFREFNIRTPLQRKAIEGKLTKENIKSMKDSRFIDSTLTKPLTNDQAISYGLQANRPYQEIDISNMNYSVEDADTIMIKNAVKGKFSKNSVVRLAGIDAPEIKHTDEGISFLRYKQDQPYGEESKKYLEDLLKFSKSVKLIVDPNQDTYGRSLGVLIADGNNINMELIKQGAALSLPFGENDTDMINRGLVSKFENFAYKSKKGLWKSDYWRTYKQTMTNDVRTTNNTLTRIDKLANNLNLAGLATTMDYAEHNSIDNFVYQASNTLRPRLADLNSKKSEYKENVLNLNYGNSQYNILDNLKVDLDNHMKNYGTSNMKLLKSSSNIGISNSVVYDSLYNSNNIYRDSLPETVTDYQNKKNQKKYRADMQKIANKNMNIQTQNAYKW